MIDTMKIPSMAPPNPADVSALRLYRGRPGALQDVRAKAGSLEIVLFWNAPQNMLGVDSWRIFQDNETNLIQQVGDRNARQTTIKMAGNAKSMFYVCAVSEFGREGPKTPVLASSDSNQIVVSGTGGATSGTASSADSDWLQQSSGGHYGTRNVQ